MLGFCDGKSYARRAHHWQGDGISDGTVIILANLPPAPTVCQALHALFPFTGPQSCQVMASITLMCLRTKLRNGEHRLSTITEVARSRCETRTQAVWLQSQCALHWLHHTPSPDGHNSPLYFQHLICLKKKKTQKALFSSLQKSPEARQLFPNNKSGSGRGVTCPLSPSSQ